MKALTAVLSLSILVSVYHWGAHNGAQQAYEDKPPHRVVHEHRARCVTGMPARPATKRM